MTCTKIFDIKKTNKHLFPGWIRKIRQCGYQYINKTHQNNTFVWEIWRPDDKTDYNSLNSVHLNVTSFLALTFEENETHQQLGREGVLGPLCPRPPECVETALPETFGRPQSSSAVKPELQELQQLWAGGQTVSRQRPDDGRETQRVFIVFASAARRRSPASCRYPVTS